MGIMGRLLARFWCWFMEFLDKHGWTSNVAYANSVVHCFCLHAFGFDPIREAYTDIFMIPIHLRYPIFEEDEENG